MCMLCYDVGLKHLCIGCTAVPNVSIRKKILLSSFVQDFAVTLRFKKTLVTYFTYLPSHQFTDSPTDILTDRMNE